MFQSETNGLLALLIQIIIGDNEFKLICRLVIEVCLLVIKKNSTNNGFTLVEILIALGIFSLISFFIGATINNFNKNISSVEEKMNILDLEKNIINLSASKNICEKKFLATPTSYTYTLSSFPSSGLTILIDGLFYQSSDTVGIAEVNKALPVHSNVVVESIEFNNISGANGSYIADLNIKFKNTIIPRKPFVTKMALTGVISGTDMVLKSCQMIPNSVSSNDNQVACEKSGGEWVQPGGTRPDFCTFSNDIIEWY